MSSYDSDSRDSGLVSSFLQEEPKNTKAMIVETFNGAQDMREIDLTPIIEKISG